MTTCEQVLKPFPVRLCGAVAVRGLDTFKITPPLSHQIRFAIGVGLFVLPRYIGTFWRV